MMRTRVVTDGLKFWVQRRIIFWFDVYEPDESCDPNYTGSHRVEFDAKEKAMEFAAALSKGASSNIHIVAEYGK